MAKARAKAICDMERPSARAAGVAGSILGVIVASRKKPKANAKAICDHPVSRRGDMRRPEKSGRRFFVVFGLWGPSPGPGTVKKRLRMKNRSRGKGSGLPGTAY